MTAPEKRKLEFFGDQQSKKNEKDGF